MCTISKVAGIKKKKQICLQNKEYLSYHRCKKIWLQNLSLNTSQALALYIDTHVCTILEVTGLKEKNKSGRLLNLITEVKEQVWLPNMKYL